MRILFTAVAFTLLCTLHAQQWNWAADAGGGGNTDFCYGIATDSQGSAYWVGTVSGSADFGCGTLAPGSTIAGFVAKADANGVCQWVRGITVGFNDAWAYGIAIDAQDRIYVTGSYDGNADFGNGITLNSMGSDDIFLARYDVDGNCIWARRAGSSGSSDEARGVAVSEDGGVFITGFSGGSTITFDNISIPNAGNARQIIVAHYDSLGTVQWAKASTGTAQGKTARAITVANDRLFITGQMGYNNASFDGIPLLPAPNTVGMYTLACDLDGNGLWARSYIGGDNEGMGISADTLGNVFVAGRMWGNLYLPDDTLASVSGNDDIMLVALDRDGEHRWAQTTGSAQRDLAWGVAADGLGNAYVAAQFNSTIDFFGTPLTSLGSEDILISKFDGNGNVVWATRPSGFQRDIPLTIHRQAAAPHELYFGGYFWGAITYGNTTIDDVQNGDAMIVAGIDTTFDVSTIATNVCPGACDGSTEAFVNGNGPFSYQRNNGSATPELDGLCPGMYIVEVTDANGQTIIDTVYVEEHADPGYTVHVANDSLWTTGGIGWAWYVDGNTLVSDSSSAIAPQTGNYHAVVTDAFGCTWSTDTVTIVLNVGIDEHALDLLTVRPNPAADRTTILWNGASAVEAVLITSAGQSVRTLKLNPGTNAVGLSGVEPGLYLLRTADGAVVRVVVE